MRLDLPGACKGEHLEGEGDGAAGLCAGQPCEASVVSGYLDPGGSSRRLEREAQRNIEVIWLLRGLKPDFKTVADFRTRKLNGAFKLDLRQFVLLCRRLDLYGRELLAVP